MRIIKALFIAFFLGCNIVSAQYFTTGDDPANIRWKQINTTDFQIIFPEEFEERAQQLAHTLEKVYTYGYRTLDHAPKKISVILHTRTVTSNGMVAWTPKRAEFYTTPNQTMYAKDWLEQLAVHEFRHVVQSDKIHSELPGILRILLGEHAASIVIGAYLPFWFLEGDAVMTETALSRAGRGRLPSFLMLQKAQVVEKGIFSYDKAVNGSYSDFVPNRYSFGYWFAGGLRRDYGPEIWSGALSEIARRPFSINPLNRVLKQQTGLTKEKQYERIFKDYAAEWKAETGSLKLTTHNTVSPVNNSYADYKNISALSDSSFIAIKESRHDIDRIVLVAPGTETILHTPGSILEESFSRTGDLLIWAEQRRHIRWTHADRSVIVVYDLKTNTKRELYPANMLHGPVISPDLKTFAAVETDYSGNYNLSVFYLQTGEPLQTYSTPSNDYFFTPAWNSNGNILYFIGLSSEGKYIGEADIFSGAMAVLTKPAFHDIRNPCYNDGKIFFTSAITGIDNIFCFDISTGQATRVTSVKFGADYSSVKNNYLFFSNYSSNGYAAARLDLRNAEGTTASEVVPAKYKLAEALAEQEDAVLNFGTSDTVKYDVQPYGKVRNLLNFHSWAPVFMDPYNYEVNTGISFMSQNKLGTASMALGYEYDLNDKTGKYQIGFEYSGLFPIFRAELSYGKRKSSGRGGVIVEEPRDTIPVSFGYSWNEFNAELNMRVPLYFNRGKYLRLLQPDVEYNYTKNINGQITSAQFPTISTGHSEQVVSTLDALASSIDGYYHTLSYRVYLLNQLRMAELDIIPRWGQSLSFVFRHSAGGGTSVGNLKAVQSYLYFPGFALNHGIRIYNGYQTNEPDKTLVFSNTVRFPRGISSFRNKELYTFGADYMMPLCYPDLSLGRWFFMKRLRSSFFYDFSNVTYVSGSQSVSFTSRLNSFGVDLTADGHILRFIAPVAVGLRTSYQPESRDIGIQFLFSINLSSF